MLLSPFAQRLLDSYPPQGSDAYSEHGVLLIHDPDVIGQYGDETGASIGYVLDALQQLPGDAVLRVGLTDPHSYRGYYDQPAITPMPLVTVEHTLESVARLLSEAFEGYKGGTYFYHHADYLNLAEYGATSRTMLTEAGVDRLVQDIIRPTDPDFKDIVRELLTSTDREQRVLGQRLIAQATPTA